MRRSPSPDSDEWVNRRFAQWRNPRSPLADADGWINPRLSKIAGHSRSRGRLRGGSRRGRVRDPQFDRCNRSAVDFGEPAGSVGDATPTGGGASGVSTGGGSGGADEVTTGGGACVAGAVSTRDEAGGEGDSSDSDLSPIMSHEEFKRRFVVTEADKAMWERTVAEVDREVDALFSLSDEHRP